MNDTTARIISQLDEKNADFFVLLFNSDFAESRGENYDTAIQSAIDDLWNGELLAYAECNDELQDKVFSLRTALIDLQKDAV